MTSKSSIQRPLHGIVVNQRRDDGYIHATALAKAYEQSTGSRKDVRNWLQTDRAKAYQELLSVKTGIPVLGLVEVKQGGKYPGTWIHPKLSIPFATWLSVEFEMTVSEWVEQWMIHGQSPLQSDLDRLVYRDSLRDDARVRMCDQIKAYLERIQRYDNRKYSGIYFARVHDALNVAVTGEKAKAIRERLGQYLGRAVKDYELIRDYFPAIYLQRYIAMCEATANFCRQGLKPLDAVEKARQTVLPHGYLPTAIDFSENIKFVRQRTVKLPAA